MSTNEPAPPRQSPRPDPGPVPGPARSAAARTPLARPPWFARRVCGTWAELAADEPASSSGAGSRPFSAADLEGLPEPVRRWLSRAIEPGTPLARTALIAMSGRVRVRDWRRFTARQVIAAGRGYVWAATAWFGPLPVFGFDRYSGGTGEMLWRVSGVAPVVSETGDDVSRSAAGRLASELVLTPAAALAPFVRWEEVDGERALARVDVGGSVHDLTVEVDGEGVLRSVRLPRWGNPDGGAGATHEFVARCSGEIGFGGYRLPARITAGWNREGERGFEPFVAFGLRAAAFR